MTTPKASRRAKAPSLASEEITSSLSKKFNVTDLEIGSPFPLTETHEKLMNLMVKNSTRMVFVSGPAGSAKTYAAVKAGLTSLKKGLSEKIVYIRSVVESASKSLGFLPGEADEKFQPWTMPLMEKLDEIVGTSRGKWLVDNGYCSGLPVNFCRGLTFRNYFVIIDEAQNLTRKELITLLTRFGEGSTYVILGDMSQADIKDSGFRELYNMFDAREDAVENNVFTSKLTKMDILRSETLRYIVDVLGDDNVPSECKKI